jgi:uncharacterized protein YndB with AHSA1/START domain
LRQDTETLTQHECLSAKPTEVFQALTDPTLQGQWTGARATGKARAGSRFTVFDEYIFGRYLELHPGTRILAEWQTVQWPPNCPPSIVEIIFEEAGEETLATVVQSLIPPGLAQPIKQEWVDRYWKPLRSYFSGITAFEPHER